MGIKHEINHLMSAIRYSLSGLKVAMRETAFRQGMVLGVVHYMLVYFINVAFQIKLVLIILWPLIMAAELFNSAVERVVDHISPEWNEFAKCAKDMCSAAVGMLIVTTITAWCLVAFHIFVR